MSITEPDFILEPVSVTNPDKFNLTFMKRVKKRNTGNYEIEPGDTLYGLTLSSAIRKIIHHRVAKKYAEDNLILKDYLKYLKESYEELKKLCYEG